MTYRDWPNPGLVQAGISIEDLMKSAAYSHFPGTSDSGFKEFIGVFDLIFRELKNAGKSLRLDKAIPEILKAH